MKIRLPRFALSSTLMCGLFIFSIPAFASANEPIDFSRAIELALENDLDIQSAGYAYNNALASRKLSRSVLLPQINATVYKRKREQERANSSNTALVPNITIDSDSQGYSLDLSQSIYNHADYQRLQQADLGIAAATATLQASQQELIVRLATAYFNVLGAQDNLKFATAEKKAIAKQLEQAQKRFDVGLIPVTDVKESQASYDIAVAQEIEADNNLAASREALAIILGGHYDKLSPMRRDVTLPRPEPNNVSRWTENAKLNNLIYQAALFEFQAAQKQVSAEMAEHLPTLDLTASRTYDDPDGAVFVSAESTDTTLTLQLNIPIYSGGGTSARHRQAVSLQEQARVEKDRALRLAIQQTRDAFLGTSSAIAQVRAFKQALESTQVAHEATQAGFDAGTRTAIDVLAALREVYRAERDYARARYTYIINTLSLKQAAGTLSIEDGHSINQFLQ